MPKKVTKSKKSSSSLPKSKLCPVCGAGMKYSPMKGKKDPWVCLIPHKNFNPLNPEEDTAGTFNMKDMGHLTKEAENLVLMQERLQDLIVQSNELAQKIRLAEEESLPALMDKIGLKEIK